MLTEIKDRQLVFILLIFSIAIRLIILLNSDDTDSLGGALPAIIQSEWSISSFIHFHNPPLGIYLMKISRLFSKSPIAVRIPSFVFGSLLVLPFYYFVKTLYGQQVAFFSSLALSIFYKHINMSVISSAEIFFYFFVFSMLYFFFKFKQVGYKKIRFLILAALSLNVATMARYEAWILIPTLSVFLIKENKKYIFCFLFISMIFPGFWMYLNYKFFGNPIEFYILQLKLYRAEYLAGLGWGTNLSLFGRLFGWIFILQQIFSPLIFWLGLIGLFFSILTRKFALPFIFLCMLSLFTLKVVKHSMFLDFRYAIFLALFFLIFVILGVNIFPKFKKTALVCLILYLFFSWIQRTIIELPHLSPPDAAILNYFKENLQRNEKILVIGSISSILIMNSGFYNVPSDIASVSERYIHEVGTGEFRINMSRQGNFAREINPEWLCDYAKFNRPKYIVIGIYDYPVLLVPDIEKIVSFFPNAKAECVLTKDVNRIYKINYEN